MDRLYEIHEMRHTLQGEGANTGKAVILLRFARCNLCCTFCDTDYGGTGGKGGGFYSLNELAQAIEGLWPECGIKPRVLCTGGEPLLQLDSALVGTLRAGGMTVMLETNGTIMPPEGIHWVCVSPKDDSAPLRSGNEVKIVWPSSRVSLDFWEGMPFTHRWLQPLHNGSYTANLQECVRYCMMNPAWRLSLQTHRYLGIP